MDLTDLANALALSKSLTVPRENNSWYGLQETPDAISGLVNQLVAKDPTGEKTGFSTRDEIIAGLGSGLLSGLFKGLGDQEQANTQGLFNQVLLGTGQGQTMAMPEGLSPGLFSQAQTTGAMLKNITDEKRYDQASKLLGTVAANQAATSGQVNQLVLAGAAGDRGAIDSLIKPKVVAPIERVEAKAPAVVEPVTVGATDFQTPVGDTYQEVLGDSAAKAVETPTPTPETVQGLKDQTIDTGMIDLGGGRRLNPDQYEAIGLDPNVPHSKAEEDMAVTLKRFKIQSDKQKVTGPTGLGRSANPLATKIGGVISAIESLNDAEQKIQALEGDDSMLGGIWRSIKTLDPNSKISNFNKNIPFLADPVTSGLQGGGTPGVILLGKTSKALTPSIGESKTQVLERYDTAKQDLINKGAGYLQALAQVGWPEEFPPGMKVPEGVKSLKQLRQEFEGAQSGDLVGQDYLKRNAPAVGGGGDLKSFIAQAKADGLSKAEAQKRWTQLNGGS